MVSISYNAWTVFKESEPGFKIDAFFDFRQRAAASQKTFGLLSKITPITPQDYKDDIRTRNREGMKKLKPDEVLNKIINNL